MPFPTVTVTQGSGLTINTLPNAGQATMANSLPVVVASDQSTIAISAASLPLPSGAATNAGSGSIATAQVSVTTGNITVAATRPGRFAITIINTGTTAVYLGITGVSTSTGLLLPGVVGASITIPTSAQIFGTVASGTQTVCVLETF